MKTKYYNWTNHINEEEVNEVQEILEKDGVIIFPTDTVYGIACNCQSREAIEKIFQIKKRAKNKPINVLTNSYEKIEKVAIVSEKEKELIEKYMPGALTIILKKKENTPSILTAGLDTIGVRIPNNKIALKILETCNVPLATTSANESGEEAGVKMEDLRDYFDGKVDGIIDGGITELQVASTIIKVEENKIHILREGSIKIEE